MLKNFIPLLFGLLSVTLSGQDKSLEILLADSSMANASVSICILNAAGGETIFELNSEESLAPASIQKLITTSAALELLGPRYTFKTIVGYRGTLNKRTGKLTGDIVIRGGGDPALGSAYFTDHYGGFLKDWVTDIRNFGIKTIEGKVLTDDSYYDFQPVPPKWLWEDSGNYYGAGVYGLSVFDNTFNIHFLTSMEGSLPVITKISPAECRHEMLNLLTASGNTDKGYVFAAPYSNFGWIAGSIPVNREDFVLKASITDPPLLLAKIFKNDLDSAGISISGMASTARLEKSYMVKDLIIISEKISPPLCDIIEVLNHESVNLYAEHLTKELGKTYKGLGSTSAGIDVIKRFLSDSGINNDGMFIEDGSGLSPLNAINTKGMVNLLYYMKKRGKHFNEFFSSLPEAGKDGTLKNGFKDPVFDSNLRAKSGSMTRVRSYAGYFKTLSGKELIFCIIVNNYTGPSKKIITGIESILKETILNR